MSEIIERLTPPLLASASSERCCAARGSRTRLAESLGTEAGDESSPC
jgi:hypothetical protein